MLQFVQGPVRPTLVSGVEHDAAVKPEGKNIGKSKDPNALNLALDAPPETGFGLLYYHDPGEVSKGSHPACKSMPVQGFVVVAMSTVRARATIVVGLFSGTGGRF